jgi:cold shock CspA family protein
MARSQASATKKEKEKKRLQKRMDKEQRKEERKANSLQGKPLEEMMAYVDEYGNISSTPPGQTKRAETNLEDIVIGATKSDDQTDRVHTGKVTFVNSAKGYGFITDDKTRESIFVHIASMAVRVQENDRVSFYTERGPKGMAAVNVKKM